MRYLLMHYSDDATEAGASRMRRSHDLSPTGETSARYRAPTTSKFALTKTWCGQFTPIMWTLY
jgi:hypothetical protein